MGNLVSLACNSDHREFGGVYNQIKRFLRDHRRRSKCTAHNYERDIRRFFKVTRNNKEIEHLAKEDLIYTPDEMEDYYAYLIDKQGVGINTANRYVTSVRECIKYLHYKKMVEDINFLNIKTYTVPSNQYGVLTIDEVLEMAEIVSGQGRVDKRMVKRYLIMFAVDTSARLADCLNLKWSNFIDIEGDREVGIRVIGKGDKEFKPKINREFYRELLQLKTGVSDYVFDIHRNSVNTMMKQLREEMNIPKERNITFHSFKKAGVDFMWKKTRDINQARKAANHSSIEVTQKYIDTDEDYGARGFFSSSNSIDEKLFQKVDIRTLKKAINQLDKGQQAYINLKVNEIVSQETLQ